MRICSPPELPIMHSMTTKRCFIIRPPAVGALPLPRFLCTGRAENSTGVPHVVAGPCGLLPFPSESCAVASDDAAASGGVWTCVAHAYPTSFHECWTTTCRLARHVGDRCNHCPFLDHDLCCCCGHNRTSRRWPGSRPPRAACRCHRTGCWPVMR